MLDEWIASVKAELGIDLDVDTVHLLDLARDAAHGVARPAAPLTTFLVGYAAAQAGGGTEAVAAATSRAAELARAWEDRPSAERTADESATPGDGDPGNSGPGPTDPAASAGSDKPGTSDR